MELKKIILNIEYNVNKAEIVGYSIKFEYAKSDLTESIEKAYQSGQIDEEIYQSLMKQVDKLYKNRIEITYANEINENLEYNVKINYNIKDKENVLCSINNKDFLSIDKCQFNLKAGKYTLYLKREDNKITITVTAEDGSKKAYNINIKREALTSDATLKNLEIEEIEKFKQNGAKIISLGKRILRTETVALNVLSIIMYELEDGRIDN